MNYTEVTKANIIDNLEDNKSSDFAFMWGVTKSSAGLQVYAQGYELIYEIKYERLANTMLFLLRKHYDMELEFCFPTQEPRSYTIKARGQKVSEMLQSMGLTYFDNGNLVYDSGVAGLKHLSNRYSVQSFFQGLFCSSGGVYIPSAAGAKEGYHLEMSFFQEDFALAVKDLLSQCGIHMQVVERGNSFVLYSKNSEIICDFFAFVKAMDCVTEVNEIIVNRKENNTINRKTNSLLFNLDKTINANIKYIDAIKVLQDKNEFDGLDDKIKSIALARLENLTETMGALATRLNITKSSLNRALTKLVKLAEGLE